MDPKRANPDQILARTASRQHGIVTLAQLRAAGLSGEAIKHRVRFGRLHRVHRGVYAVGHRALSNEARWIAAVLARGPGAVLSHRSAALGEIRTDRTRSANESAFLRLCRRHGVPDPEINVTIGPYTVDFLWREQGLVVEVDGYGAHRGRQAFLDDRERELYLHSLGLRVRRFSDEQVAERASAVVEAVRADCAADSWPTPSR